MTPGHNFFTKLKQRKLVQWSVAYVAAAFALLQGVDIVAQRFDWPEQTMRLVIIALSVGLFVTLVLAWYHGERGAQRVSGTELLILTLLLSLGGFFLWRYASASPEPVTKGAPLSPSASLSIPPKSIAVLPFENLSRDPENAYFSEGIQDEILTRLAKIGDFKVISRTSTAQFRSKPENVSEIARLLGVANILEGSVQKAGNSVRVNVQLIHAGTDTHLWAETYDRELTDIFAVESEIAKAVAENLNARLNGRANEVLAARPTDKPAAHEFYLRGRYLWNRRSSASLQKAAEFFQKAIDLDPNYALAYAGLADVYSITPMYTATAPREVVPKAIAAARKAVELDEKLAEAHTALGNALSANVQLSAAEQEFRRALELNPNYATAHQWLSECLFAQERFQESLAEIERAYELDPLSLIINASYASSLGGVGRFEEAITRARKTLELDPDLLPGHEILGQTYEAMGQARRSDCGIPQSHGAGTHAGKLRHAGPRLCQDGAYRRNAQDSQPAYRARGKAIRRALSSRRRPSRPGR